jgi:hypothetical protein
VWSRSHCEFGHNWKSQPCPGEVVLFYSVVGIDRLWLVARCKDHPLEDLYKKDGQYWEHTADEFAVLEVHEA